MTDGAIVLVCACIRRVTTFNRYHKRRSGGSHASSTEGGVSKSRNSVELTLIQFDRWRSLLTAVDCHSRAFS